MVRHTLKILQQMLQDFESVSDHFGALCMKGLNYKVELFCMKLLLHQFCTPCFDLVECFPIFYSKCFIIAKNINIHGDITRNGSNLPSLVAVLPKVNLLSANPTKCSNALKQFVGFCRRIV